MQLYFCRKESWIWWNSENSERGSSKKIVQNLQNKNAEVKIEKITEVYLKEEEEPFTEFVDQKEEEEPITESVDQKDALQWSKGEKFACDECGAVLSSDKIWQRHKKNVHGDKLFPCDQCDYKTKRTNGLKLHKNIVHEGIMPYQCKECDYKASTSSTLTKHNKSNHGGIMHYCSTCNFSTAMKSRLKVHMEGVHEKLKRKCSFCDYKVLAISTLNEHINSVYKGVTYPCDRCVYVGKQKRDLKKHISRKHVKKCNSVLQ